jgi:uncharacterized repeat protein (TIGR03847 family)
MSKELGLVDVLGAEAIGAPGQRRFCMFTKSRRGSAILWMEKEQLNQLSLALDRALAQLTEGQVLRTEAQAGNQPKPPGMPPNFPRSPEYDFREAQIGLTYNGQEDTFALTVAPVELLMEPGQEPQAIIREEDAVSFEFSQEQAHELSTSITALLTGGRPVCPLCGTPLDGGPHACVKQNGHYEIVQIADDDDEEENE